MNKIFSKVVAAVTAAALVFSSFLINEETVAAAKATEQITKLRILTTTDLHGMATDFDFNRNSVNANSGLAKVYTLMKEATEEMDYGGVMKFDCGDTMYGLMSDSIAEGRVTGPDYMFATMKLMGYDAITLGNHDFQYDLDYLHQTLGATGFEDKVVLANICDAKTREPIWTASKIITKNLTTDTGDNVSVKVGIIGVTVPTITTAVSDHVGELLTRDIVECADEEAEKLHEAGAEIIVILAHTGFGAYEYEEYSEQAAYELCSTEYVDVVCAGHYHMNFPSSDEKSQFLYDYYGVNDNGVITQTVAVQTKDRAGGIGVVDLDIKIKNGKAKVADGRSHIEYVDENTVGDPDIERFVQGYWDQLQPYYNEKVVDLEGEANNYRFAVEDNGAIQALNEAKLKYGLNFLANHPNYDDCRVIAASTYNTNGKSGDQDYYNISGSMTRGDSLRVAERDRTLVKMYRVSGAELLEWIEWSVASAYETGGGNSVNKLNAQWDADRSGFNVFDGVEYTIDYSKPAKYSKLGKVINSGSRRVTSLTVNGKPVDSKDYFLVVCDNTMVKSNWPPTEKISIHQVNASKIYSNQMLCDYMVNSVNADGRYELSADNNWSVGTAVNNSKPLLVLSTNKTAITGKSVQVITMATSKNGISKIEVTEGYRGLDDDWNFASEVSDGSFSVSENGTYSVKATDSRGNSTVKYITISNIKPGAVEAPTVSSFTNHMKQVKGKAEPGTTIHVLFEGKEFITITDEEGNFKCQCDYANADDIVEVWSVDINGAASESEFVTVERDGGNQPDIVALDNKEFVLTGVMNDDMRCVTVAIEGSTIYIPESGDVFQVKESGLTKGKKIVEVKCVYGEEYFYMQLPTMLSGTKLNVYSVDWLFTESRAAEVEVARVVPDNPTVNGALANDTIISGNVPGKVSMTTEIEVTGQGKVFTGSIDENGNFAVKTDSLMPGSIMTVTAKDVIDGNLRESMMTLVTVTPTVVPKKPVIINKKLTSKTKVIKVLAKENATVSVKAGKEVFTAVAGQYSKKKGGYVYKVDITPVKSGKKIKVWQENMKGSGKKTKGNVLDIAGNIK